MSTVDKKKVIIWWVLWLAILQGMILIYFILGRSAPSPQIHASPEVMRWALLLGPLLISTFLRWGLLPRARNAGAALPLFIMGLALAESICMFGVLMFPQHKQEFFVTSLIGIFQYLPYFAGRFSRPEGN